MSIKDFLQKIKLFLGNIKDKTYSQEKGIKMKDDLYITIIIILVGTASFGLGKISSFEKSKIPISVLKTKEYMYSTVLSADQVNLGDTYNTNLGLKPEVPVSGVVVASKSGTKYYYPWCTGVSKIREENKVWFNTIEEARSAGLSPTSNCAGLK